MDMDLEFAVTGPTFYNARGNILFVSGHITTLKMDPDKSQYLDMVKFYIKMVNLKDICGSDSDWTWRFSVSDFKSVEISDWDWNEVSDAEYITVPVPESMRFAGLVSWVLIGIRNQEDRTLYDSIFNFFTFPYEMIPFSLNSPNHKDIIIMVWKNSNEPGFRWWIKAQISGCEFLAIKLNPNSDYVRMVLAYIHTQMTMENSDVKMVLSETDEVTGKPEIVEKRSHLPGAVMIEEDCCICMTNKNTMSFPHMCGHVQVPLCLICLIELSKKDMACPFCREEMKIMDDVPESIEFHISSDPKIMTAEKISVAWSNILFE
ncbi:RING-finger-containing E3 ubiquitin ligase [Salmon gill poxvirus]|uniref:RING-finger-containing E3 ubiquitin ligase n=1 Tax=Salmon gill poxvirus TaxID=1680908 RepID=A0A0H4XWN6_9POXV|nr:RING-finger-containing E3 ubiquitin ligase [Salmon gill poxvirus]AKR04263.1 RING-finger-containing E3 ubiquitin ligase [Salmon gill poxvirus]